MKLFQQRKVRGGGGVTATEAPRHVSRAAMASQSSSSRSTGVGVGVQHGLAEAAHDFGAGERRACPLCRVPAHVVAGLGAAVGERGSSKLSFRPEVGLRRYHARRRLRRAGPGGLGAQHEDHAPTGRADGGRCRRSATWRMDVPLDVHVLLAAAAQVEAVRDAVDANPGRVRGLRTSVISALVGGVIADAGGVQLQAVQGGTARGRRRPARVSRSSSTRLLILDLR